MKADLFNCIYQKLFFMNLHVVKGGGGSLILLDVFRKNDHKNALKLTDCVYLNTIFSYANLKLINMIKNFGKTSS